MPIREIDPNDPALMYGAEPTARTKSKSVLSSFIQKKDPFRMTEVKPVQEPKPEPVVASVPEQIVYQQVSAPQSHQVRSTDTLPQVRLKVPQLPFTPLANKRPIPPSPIPEPVPAPQPIPAKEPAYITDPVKAAERIMQRHVIPDYVWPKKPEPVAAPVNEYQYPDSADIYGTGTGFKLPSFFQKEKQFIPPEEHITQPVVAVDWKSMGGLIAQVGIGIVAVWFGLTSTGSYFEPASRFSGDLATIFYGYQLGTLLTIFGCFLGYDAFRKAGKL